MLTLNAGRATCCIVVTISPDKGNEMAIPEEPIEGSTHQPMEAVNDAATDAATDANDQPLPRAKILIPLYLYPQSAATWQPLYEAIAHNPTFDFLIVVNPRSGPGGHPLPSHDYIREVPKLNAFPNVQTVGYVLVNWCRRPLSVCMAEIDTYAGWAGSGVDGLHVEGIYLDEPHNHFSAERAEYLHALRRYIRSVPGLGDRRLVVENPGTPPDRELTWYAGCGPDVVITSEEPYARFAGPEVQQRLREYPYAQSQTGLQISAVPRDRVGAVTRALRRRGKYLFVTDTVDDFYESFGAGWLDFIAAFGDRE